MAVSPKVRSPIVCLVFFLALSTSPSVHAQLLQTQEWDQWNAVSLNIFPDENWQQFAAPEEAGWSSENLKSAHKISQVAGSAAIMVIYDGAVLTQWGQIERRFMCHSIRKSLLSALYGLAVAKGNIDIDETIGSIGIDDDTGLTPTEKSARVSDLLKSRSGVYLPAAYETPSMRRGRPERGSHEPGTHWYYNNWDFNVLATIYNWKTKGDVFEAFHSEIAVPVRMQDFELRHAYYHLEPEYSRYPAYPFRMSARDLARFGLLFLREGKWNDSQIIPSEWVRESTKGYSKAYRGGYGYMWWTESGQLGELGAYAAIGYGGHAVYVVPGAKLVFVHRGDTYGRRIINFGSVRNILRQILKARIGPPRAAPQLFPLLASLPADSGLALREDQLSALTGQYRHEGLEVTVRAIGGRLEVESSRLGRFYIIARSPTEFLIEDAELPLKFELDAAGRSTAMQIWFTSDEFHEMSRVP